MVSGAFNSTDTFQVLSHLEPMDLLRLALVDKTFQRFLMSKNSAFLWKAARRNVPGLPEILPGMSEPAYAHLMFSPLCQVRSSTIPSDTLHS